MKNYIKLLLLALCVCFLTGCTYTFSITGYYTEVNQIGDDYLITINNTSNEEKDVNVSFELLDKNNKVLDTVEDSFICLPKKDKAIIRLTGIENTNYTKYRVKVSGDKSIYMDLTSSLTYTEHLTSTNKVNKTYEFKNNGDEVITNYNIMVVYYKDNKPVDSKWYNYETLRPGSKRKLEVTYDDKLYDSIELFYNAYQAN